MFKLVAVLLVIGITLGVGFIAWTFVRVGSEYDKDE